MQNFVIVEGLPWCTWRKPEFFLRGLQAHLGRRARLSVAGRFCESESRVLSRHCCGAEFGIVKLSFSKRAG